MPRETRSRLTPPAAGGSPPTTAGTAQRPIVSLLAQISQPSDLLPHLHQHALDVTGGACSLLFQHNPRAGGVRAPSGFGLDGLNPEPWLPGTDEAALVADAFTRRLPTLVSDVTRQT